jgi:hypothetical protein
LLLEILPAVGPVFRETIALPKLFLEIVFELAWKVFLVAALVVVAGVLVVVLIVILVAIHRIVMDLSVA